MRRKTLSFHLPFLVCLMILTLAPKQTPSRKTVPIQAKHFETRCGWFSNPTPANASLYDRQGEWIIGVQGGYQVEGDWPPFGDKQWIETNGSYGDGCACFRLLVDRKTHHVIAIKSAKALPLSACRADKALKRWEFK